MRQVIFHVFYNPISDWFYLRGTFLYENRGAGRRFFWRETMPTRFVLGRRSRWTMRPARVLQRGTDLGKNGRRRSKRPGKCPGPRYAKCVIFIQGHKRLTYPLPFQFAAYFFFLLRVSIFHFPLNKAGPCYVFGTECSPRVI